MNRREFTATLASTAAAPLVPMPVGAAGTAGTAAALPSSTYAWAQLIVRAQRRASPTMLARHLRLDPASAQRVFDMLVRDGVLSSPAAGHAARALNPLPNPAASSEGSTHLGRIAGKLKERLQQREQADPLVNPDEPCLGCGETRSEDAIDASTDQPVQNCPEKG